MLKKTLRPRYSEKETLAAVGRRMVEYGLETVQLSAPGGYTTTKLVRDLSPKELERLRAAGWKPRMVKS